MIGVLGDGLWAVMGVAAASAGGGAEAESSGGEWARGALLAGGMVVVCGTLLLRVYRKTRGRRGGGDVERARDKIERLSSTRERDSLESLMVEVQELTRTCAAQIETRALRLEKLLDVADARIAALEGRLAEAKPEDGGSGGSVAAAGSLAMVAAPRDGGDPVLRRVLALTDEGKSAEEIAKLTGTALGKVELMIRLHRRASA